MSAADDVVGGSSNMEKALKQVGKSVTPPGGRVCDEVLVEENFDSGLAGVGG